MDTPNTLVQVAKNLVAGTAIAAILTFFGYKIYNRVTDNKAAILFSGTVKEYIADAEVDLNHVAVSIFWNNDQDYLQPLASPFYTYVESKYNNYKVIVNRTNSINYYNSEVFLFKKFPTNFADKSIFLSAIGTTEATTGKHSLTVNIFDANNQPLPNKSVRLTPAGQPNVDATTDSAGNAYFSNLERNKAYTLRWNGKSMPFTTNYIPFKANITAPLAW